MADSPDELAFQHTCLAQTCLPHRRPPDGVRRWQRDQGRAHLLIVAGEAWHEKEQRFIEIGLPYGPKARLILMHLNSEALRQDSPVVEVESSLTAFVRRIQDRPPTGPEIRAYKEQLTRLSAAMVRLAIGQGDHSLQVDTKIVGAFDLWFAKDARQRVMWPSVVRLSLDYFESLKRHAVPLDERALAALAHSALALDMYCWLAQRLHRTAAYRTIPSLAHPARAVRAGLRPDPEVPPILPRAARPGAGGLPGSQDRCRPARPNAVAVATAGAGAGEGGASPDERARVVGSA